MASKEVPWPFGFWGVVCVAKPFNLQNFRWISRIITSLRYSKAGKEAKAKANGEVAGRPGILSFCINLCAGTNAFQWHLKKGYENKSLRCSLEAVSLGHRQKTEAGERVNDAKDARMAQLLQR